MQMVMCTRVVPPKKNFKKNQEVDGAAKTEVAQVNLDKKNKEKLLPAHTKTQIDKKDHKHIKRRRKKEADITSTRKKLLIQGVVHNFGE